MAIQIAKIKVTGIRVEVEKLHPVTSGMVGVTVVFAFDSTWDGLAKTAVFKAGTVTRDVPDIGEEVTIPHEVMADPGVSLLVGVYGTNAEGVTVIPTIYGNIAYILNGADPSGDPSTDPTLPVWADHERRLKAMEEGNGDEIDPEEIKQIVDEYLEETLDIEIPSRLPNPHALTFTGAVEAVYDGSAPLSVNIPDGTVAEEQIARVVKDYMDESTVSGGGLSTTAVNLLIEILEAAVYSTNVSGKIASLKEALATGGGSGGDVPDSPDEPTVTDEITVSDGVMTIVSVGSEITVSGGVMTIG